MWRAGAPERTEEMPGEKREPVVVHLRNERGECGQTVLVCKRKTIDMKGW